ncbi:hypothetical protein, variant 1 [Verruconis gallopava]|uniref:dual-specificity kinase n=1 Tax=Verruconis gallopava TaxID=253628 RepID=A0A0D2AEJ0_9PEZI|nr:hypothetical protein, variant 1 [Verruconis gallopava]KIW04875.1 hypothetical protein, variant 1 [Verruconis gallopava]
MSTPTTLNPAHHQYYSPHSAHHSVANYHANGAMNGTTRQTAAYYNGYAPNGASDNSDLRRAATSNARPSNQLPPIQTSPPSTAAYPPSNAPMKREKRKPDWNEFYKNGVPSEIIVIDDSPEPEPRRANGGAYTSQHGDKRQRTGNAYDPVYNPQPSYSTTQTPYYENSTSTDRTTSAYLTTAPTSLGSSAGNGTYLPPLDDGAVGQKRKRTRAQAAEDAGSAKRREVERLTPPHIHYIPPEKPIIKAKEVHVEVIRDKHATTEQYDDEDGHYNVVAGASLTDRYTIVRLLGQGTFGKVVEAIDRDKGTKCAVKIIRSVQKYRDASRIELRVLSTLAQNDKHNRNKCIHLRQCFDYRNHICIVTDLYGQSVFDFLKNNNFTPFPSSHIQTFARQLFTSVAFLHDLNLIHTDLKPENILLVDNSYQTFTYNRNIPSSSTATQRSSKHRKVLLTPEIRLIDFGSATFDDEYHSSVVSTRHYRAPEIILNLGWSFPCDIWSIGCILVEFYTGDALFQTHDNLEHLAMMEAVCGSRIDRQLVQAVLAKDRNGTTKNPAAQYFKVREKKLDYPNHETAKASRKYVRAMKRLEETITPHNEFNRQFLDLLRKIFVYNPAKRISAKQALKHPWFKETLQDDGTEAARIREQKLAKRMAAQAESNARANGASSSSTAYR